MKLDRFIVMLLLAGSSYHSSYGCALCVGKVDLTSPPFFHDEQEGSVTPAHAERQALAGDIQQEERGEEL